MKGEVFWIDGPWTGRLAILPRPRGGDWLADEVRGWRAMGLGVVVSLLTEEEVASLDLSDERKTSEESGIRFISFPIADRATPLLRGSFSEVLEALEKDLADGKCVGIHCRQGIGRSALVGACLLTSAGLTPEEAFQRVSAARRSSVPETAEQRRWVEQFAHQLPKQVR